MSPEEEEFDRSEYTRSPAIEVKPVKKGFDASSRVQVWGEQDNKRARVGRRLLSPSRQKIIRIRKSRLQKFEPDKFAEIGGEFVGKTPEPPKAPAAASNTGVSPRPPESHRPSGRQGSPRPVTSHRCGTLRDTRRKVRSLACWLGP